MKTPTGEEFTDHRLQNEKRVILVTLYAKVLYYVMGIRTDQVSYILMLTQEE